MHSTPAEQQAVQATAKVAISSNENNNINKNIIFFIKTFFKKEYINFSIYEYSNRFICLFLLVLVSGLGILADLSVFFAV